MIRYIKSFFYNSEGNPQPTYFWISFFCILVIIAFIKKLNGNIFISDKLLLGLCGFIVAWMGVYNFGKNSSEKNKNESEIVKNNYIQNYLKNKGKEK